MPLNRTAKKSSVRSRDADPKLRLRLILRETETGKIYDRAGQVSDPEDDSYGRYASRAEVIDWSSISKRGRREVLSRLASFQVSEVGKAPDALSPLIFVSAEKSKLARLFQDGVLDRLDPSNGAGVEIHSWEWANELARVETLIRSIHVVYCVAPPRPSTVAAPLKAATHSSSRAASGKSSLSNRIPRQPMGPNRGWLFPHLGKERRHHALQHARHDAPSAKSRLEDGATPAMLRTHYNFPETLSGEGQTIAIMTIGCGTDARRAIEGDLATFWNAFGIEGASLDYVEVGPQAEATTSELLRLEASMGPAWIHALVPKAKIVVYEMALDLPDPWLAAIEMAVADVQHRPTVLCMTWTMPEEVYYRQFDRASIALALAKAAALGITVVTATGDWGVYDGRPSDTLKADRGGRVARAAWPHATFPACEDRVLAVGGTQLSALEPATELGWSGPLPPDPDLAHELQFTSLATSGGFSQRVPVPDWQQRAVIGERLQRSYSRGSSLPAVLPYGRGYPDVALMAAGPSLTRGNPETLSATGYQLVIDGKWINYAGGTSMAAPVWASVIAAINQNRAEQNPPRPTLGFANPALYYLGWTRPISGQHAVLRKIKNGNSDLELRVVTGQALAERYTLAGYRSQSQWDPVTGLGVPNVENLAQALLEYPSPPALELGPRRSSKKPSSPRVPLRRSRARGA